MSPISGPDALHLREQGLSRRVSQGLSERCSMEEEQPAVSEAGLPFNSRFTHV